ncbi:MAG: Uncharacterized protein XD52_0080 [bacterium 42_11]|nr:MAG: Uncharacterized protein XD52_0080 [bacterium 42_11]
MRKVTLPRMGYSYIGFRAVFDELGHEFFEPLPLTKRTLDLGVKHAPEFACFPFKITLGNLIEALETGKVDTIITAGGIGPCRYGFYGVMYEKILKEELGYNFDFILLDPPVKPYGSFKRVWDIVLKWKSELSWRDFIKRLVRGFKLAWRKLKRVEELEALLLKKRAWVKDSSKVEAIFKSAIDKMNLSRDLDEVDRIFEEAREKMESIPPERDNVLKVGVVGEIYTILEPFSNLNTEKLLNERGVEIERAVWTTEFIEYNISPGLPFPLKQIVGYKGKEEIEKYSKPFLNEFVGGHGRETVAHTVMFKKKGFDGVVHILPFSCMPEVVARSILERVSRELDIPVLSLSFDEFTGEAGLITRLEAFIDLLQMRRRLAA